MINIQYESARVKVKVVYKIRQKLREIRQTGEKGSWWWALCKFNGDNGERAVANLGRELSMQASRGVRLVATVVWVGVL